VKRILVILALAAGSFAVTQNASQAALLGAAALAQTTASTSVEQARYYYTPAHPRRPLYNLGVGPNARPYDYRPIFVARCYRPGRCYR
jgi:hypothetical protein